MTEDAVKELSKITEDLNGYTTSKGSEDASEARVKGRTKKRKQKRVKQPNEGGDSGDIGKKIYTQRCSNGTISAEAILISGDPRFLVLNKIDSAISIQNVVHSGSTIYLPYEPKINRLIVKPVLS